VSPDDKTPPRPQWAKPQAPRPQAPKPANPEGDQERAEQRMREEMARQRRQEETHLKTLKLGCIGVIAALLVAMIIAFLV
jgi:hypothetical protein